MMDAKQSVWSKWRRFRRLPPFKREIVVCAMVSLPLTEIGLRAMGFRRWKRLIEHFSLSGPRRRDLESATQLNMAERIARAASSAELHGLGTPNCLERSLTLWWLLRREDIEAELHIGARKSDSRFEAHAWIELRGAVLNDSPR